MVRRFAAVLALTATALTATPAFAWSPISIHVNIGVPAAEIVTPLAIGGVVVSPGVIFEPDGQLVFRNSADLEPVVVAESEPLRELVVYEPGGLVRTVVVRDWDYPRYEHFLLVHHARFYWRSWHPGAGIVHPGWARHNAWRAVNRDREGYSGDDPDYREHPGNAWGRRR